MLQAMFAGVSGIQAHQTRMNTIGNNISNVNTTGFKSQRVSFQDQLSLNIRSAAAATKNNGGVNPGQLGLGVQIGAVDTLNIQGNLQSTGKGTDLAIQGNGYFMVANNGVIEYTRDGSFDLDSNGVLVNPATGVKVLGYQADMYGKLDPTAPVTAASAIQIPIGTRSDARQTSKVGALGNLDAAAALLSTKVDYTGNLNQTAPSTETVTTKSTAFDFLGNPHEVITTFSKPVNNPTGVAVPAGATRAWSVNVKVDNATVFDSAAAGKSKAYWVGGKWQFANTTNGALLGSTIQLNGLTAASNQGNAIPGTDGAPDLKLDLNYGPMTNANAASSLVGAANGQTGTSPTWGSSIQVYDSLGVGHLVTFKYTHAHLGTAPPVGATGRWNWTAMEGDQVIGSSSDTGNTPLYFNSTGQLVGEVTQTINVKPTNGATTPFKITVDNRALTQLAKESNAVIGSQDGTAVGILQNFTISAEGVITGVFTSGQSRIVGQLAMASFPNGGGLERTGGNRLSETPNSGGAQVGVADAGGRGKISTGYLELSNVDLSTEFTNLIITERGFQANTRIISVVDGLLQDVINLKR
jgi:flagellar hook protein FlgE